MTKTEARILRDVARRLRNGEGVPPHLYPHWMALSSHLQATSGLAVGLLAKDRRTKTDLRAADAAGSL